MACVVALLGSLEELSQGEGLTQGQLELLGKLEDADGWEKVEQNNLNRGGISMQEDSPQTIPKFTVADEPFDEQDHPETANSSSIGGGGSGGKPKHIRWEMDEDVKGTPGGYNQVRVNVRVGKEE